MWGSLTLSGQAGSPEAGQEIYLHHSWWRAVAACVLILYHTAQGQWSGDVLNTAGTIKVERNWKRSFLLHQTRKSASGEKYGQKMRRFPLEEVLLPQWAPTTAIFPSGSPGKTGLSFPTADASKRELPSITRLYTADRKRRELLERRDWTHLEKRWPGSRRQPQKVQKGLLRRSSWSCWVEMNCRSEAGLLQGVPHCAWCGIPEFSPLYRERQQPRITENHDTLEKMQCQRCHTALQRKPSRAPMTAAS